jgi:hypothetical protein
MQESARSLQKQGIQAAELLTYRDTYKLLLNNGRHFSHFLFYFY